MIYDQLVVKDWMVKFEQETPPKPTIPSLDVRKLRVKLMFEEVMETISALGINILLRDKYDGQGWLIDLSNQKVELQVAKENLTIEDLVEIADGLADQHFVGYCGTGVACGLDMAFIFDEVVSSNFSKLWTQEEVNSIVVDDELCHKQVLPDNFEHNFLVKNKDGKVIKSPSYSPANLKRVIDIQLQDIN